MFRPAVVSAWVFLPKRLTLTPTAIENMARSYHCLLVAPPDEMSNVERRTSNVESKKNVKASHEVLQQVVDEAQSPLGLMIRRPLPLPLSPCSVGLQGEGAAVGG